MRSSALPRPGALLLASVLLVACGDDANDQLIGAECTATAECDNEELTCLTDFSGGYCGARGCASDADCPDGSMCVTEEGTNYCFLMCTDKSQCNDHRSTENEANCESSITPVDDNQSKACVPPSSDL